MVTLWQIIETVGAAIVASSDVHAVCDKYKLPPTVLLGFDGDKPLYAEGSGPIIAITPSEQPYDVGYTGDVARSAAITIRWAVFDNSAISDGHVTRYTAVQSCDELGAAIYAALLGIDGLGDEAKEVAVAIDASEWPNVVGEAEVIFEMARGLNMEPEIT